MDIKLIDEVKEKIAQMDEHELNSTQYNLENRKKALDLSRRLQRYEAKQEGKYEDGKWDNDIGNGMVKCLICYTERKAGIPYQLGMQHTHTAKCPRLNDEETWAYLQGILKEREGFLGKMQKVKADRFFWESKFKAVKEEKEAWRKKFNALEKRCNELSTQIAGALKAEDCCFET